MEAHVPARHGVRCIGEGCIGEGGARNGAAWAYIRKDACGQVKQRRTWLALAGPYTEICETALLW